MSKIEVNQISSQCGSTLTIGQSGDTVTLASGATQSGFGRTGTVDWDTTAKTTGFTAVSGNGYFVNTTSGAITVTTPASPSAGDIFSLADYAATWDTNAVTVSPNGTDKIGGQNANASLTTKGQSVTFVYVDSTQGWINTMDSTSNVRGNAFIIATGGTITTCGDYKIHTFTGPGTFCVSCAGIPANSNADYLVIAGGAGGGYCRGGGGGGGGTRESSGAASGCYTASPLGACVSALPITVQGYPITVGAGGSAGTVPAGPNAPQYGSNSVFSTITSTGGGAGSGSNIPVGTPTPERIGGPGGSGGGGAGSSSCQGSNAGTGNTPPVSPPQGQNGAPGYDGPNPSSGGGGGGAGSVAQAAAAPYGGGDGGIGITTSISGTATKYAGGGGGGNAAPTGGNEGVGGINPGGSPGPLPSRYGAGSGGNNGAGDCGVANLGGGGGGGGGAGGTNSNGGAGGSGIVIIRYKYQ